MRFLFIVVVIASHLQPFHADHSCYYKYRPNEMPLVYGPRCSEYCIKVFNHNETYLTCDIIGENACTEEGCKPYKDTGFIRCCCKGNLCNYDPILNISNEAASSTPISLAMVAAMYGFLV